MSRRKSHKLMTLIAGASLVAVAAAGAAQASSAPAASGGGGELVDLGTFALGPPEHLDPALNTTLDSQQVINALYDGLTAIDSTDPANPKVVPAMASRSCRAPSSARGSGRPTRTSPATMPRSSTTSRVAPRSSPVMPTRSPEWWPTMTP